MNLHGQIMNLACVPTNMDAEPHQRLAYKVGHRDARHAAADMALAADSERDELMMVVARMIDAHYSGSLDHQPAYVKMARTLLQRFDAAATCG